jgi:ribosomal protein S8
MVRISVLGDALKTMYNAEKRGKRQVLIRPASKVVIKFLQLMQKHGYISEFELCVYRFTCNAKEDFALECGAGSAAPTADSTS